MGKENKKKSLPAWDNTINDLSIHKLSPEELERKRQTLKSHNHTSSIEQFKEKRKAEKKLSGFIQSLEHQLNSFAYSRDGYALPNNTSAKAKLDPAPLSSVSESSSPAKPLVVNTAIVNSSRPYVSLGKVIQLYNTQSAHHNSQVESDVVDEKSLARVLHYPSKLVNIEGEIEHFEHTYRASTPNIKSASVAFTPQPATTSNVHQPYYKNSDTAQELRHLQLQVCKLEKLKEGNRSIPHMALLNQVTDLARCLLEYCANSQCADSFVPVLQNTTNIIEFMTDENGSFARSTTQQNDALEQAATRILELEKMLATEETRKSWLPFQQPIAQYNKAKEFDSVGLAIHQLRHALSSSTIIPNSRLNGTSISNNDRDFQGLLLPQITTKSINNLDSTEIPNQNYNEYSKALLARQQSLVSPTSVFPTYSARNPPAYQTTAPLDQQIPDMGSGFVYDVKIITGKKNAL